MHLSAASPQVKVADDAIWRRITEAANATYRSGNFRHAMSLYHDALDEAERLFVKASSSIAFLNEVEFGSHEENVSKHNDSGVSVPVPVIYNISCHNLAEIVERSGDAEATENFLVRAYDKLLTSAGSPETPLPLRIDCVRHLEHALALLVQHLQRRAAPDARIASYVDGAKTTAFAVFHAAKHAEIAGLTCNHCAVRPS